MDDVVLSSDTFIEPKMALISISSHRNHCIVRICCSFVVLNFPYLNFTTEKGKAKPPRFPLAPQLDIVVLRQHGIYEISHVSIRGTVELMLFDA